MKVAITEHNGCFEFALEPETMQDQVMLTRMGLNLTKQLRSFAVRAWGDLTMTAYMVFGKRKRPNEALN